MKTVRLCILAILIFLVGTASNMNGQTGNALKTVDRIIKSNNLEFEKPFQLGQFVNQKFETEEEKARAIYIWLADNIAYDVENVFSDNRKPPKLNMKKGVCSDYANLFVQTAKIVDLDAYTVQGFTKQEGQVQLIPHAWVAAEIGEEWFFFDPTWAAGYIQEGRFHKNINTDYFKTGPEDFIKTHFPYDPFWQILEEPIKAEKFEKSDLLPKRTANPDFSKQLKELQALDDLEQLKQEYKRIEENGICNFLLYFILREKKALAKSWEEHQFLEKLNEAQYEYEDGVFLLNEFITYRNNFFEPYESDLSLKKKIGSVIAKLEDAEEHLGEPADFPDGLNYKAANLKRGIDLAFVNVQELKEFVKKYVETPKGKRDSLFYD